MPTIQLWPSGVPSQLGVSGGPSQLGIVACQDSIGIVVCQPFSYGIVACLHSLSSVAGPHSIRMVACSAGNYGAFTAWAQWHAHTTFSILACLDSIGIVPGMPIHSLAKLKDNGTPIQLWQGIHSFSTVAGRPLCSFNTMACWQIQHSNRVTYR